MILAINDWKLRLFHSVDLIGSSVYKAKKRERNDDVEWCNTFGEFYQDFPKKLLGQYNELLDYLDSDDVDKSSFPKPKIWKILGDEILFYTDITHEKQILIHIIALKKALIEYNDLLDQKKIPIVRCKGTTWLAGFPVNNIEIDSSGYKDFIGPSVDAGFRLTQFASQRKLVISIDALLMFSTAMRDFETNETNETKGRKITNENLIRFDGKFELKGVYNNDPYPIFWLDAYPETFEKEDEWMGIGKNCDYLDAMQYSERYIKNNEYMIRPFIAEATDSKFSVIPNEMKVRRENSSKFRKKVISAEEILIEIGNELNKIKL